MWFSIPCFLAVERIKSLDCNFLFNDWFGVSPMITSFVFGCFLIISDKQKSINSFNPFL
jgi:hypothetical protein